jgi:alkylhydroperoxidase family enzyme
MTPQAKAIVCQHEVENKMTGSPENSAAFIPSQSPKRGPKRATTDLTLIDAYLEPRLGDLVRLRVSQIHGCKWSVQEQKTKLKIQGETYQRLSLLEDWRKEVIFSDREKAALNLAEAVTRDPITTVPDVVFHTACLIFNESEVICLILVILAANDWHYLKG